MPPLPVIPNTFRCAINWDAAGGQNAKSVIHIYAPGKTSAQVAAAIDTHTNANMFIDMCDLAVGDHVDVTPLDGTTATTEYPLTTWLGPLVASNFVPALASLVTFYSTLRGRSYRGRIYLPFVDTSAVSEGVHLTPINPPAQATAWANWSTGIAGAGFTHCIASYKHASQVAVSTYEGHQPFATQRRRQGRLRP